MPEKLYKPGDIVLIEAEVIEAREIEVKEGKKIEYRIQPLYEAAAHFPSVVVCETEIEGKKTYRGPDYEGNKIEKEGGD